ncbi:tumor necrosis factor receptor superfamily member 8-like [Pyxicephalus adspersus]
MALNRTLLLTLIASAVTFQVTMSSSCHSNKYYDPTQRRCCGNCPEGMEKRSSCIQDIKKDCAERCGAGRFIDWNQTPPRCATCNKCKKDDWLVEIQGCSLHTEAICQCQAGFYCQSSLGTTCARCVRHKECPHGQGVKTKGSAEKDTECEACPPGTYSNINSATEKCTPYTETSTSASMIPSARQRHTTPRVHTVRHISATLTVLLPTTSAKDEDDRGKWNAGYIAAMIICILILLVALVMVLKQNPCRLKSWIKKKKSFIQPNHRVDRTVITYQEDGKEQNSDQSQLISLDPCHRVEVGQIEQSAAPKTEMQQGKDYLNNKIEKIYIMNADTVLVGSISEVPSRCQRSVMVESEEKKGLVLESRYPEQESSKVQGNDLMVSIEEEEREATTAKVILQG